MTLKPVKLSKILAKYENESLYLAVTFNNIIPIVIKDTYLEIIGNWFDFEITDLRKIIKLSTPNDISHLNLITYIIKSL